MKIESVAGRNGLVLAVVLAVALSVSVGYALGFALFVLTRTH